MEMYEENGSNGILLSMLTHVHVDMCIYTCQNHKCMRKPSASDERWPVGNSEACAFCRAVLRAVSKVNFVMFVISEQPC